MGRFYLFVVAISIIIYMTLDGYFNTKIDEEHAFEIEADPDKVKVKGYFA